MSHPTTSTSSMPHALPDADERLAALERRVREDLETTSHSRDWIPRTDGDDDVLDVLVIGGGQAGLAVAFGLQRERIDRVLVVDDGPAERVGCWDRYARMHTLRSPKHMKGIELDVPSLHVRRWFEAVYGEQAWAEIDLVPRLDWNDYLRWYRDVTGVSVEHETSVVAVHRPDEPDGAFAVEMRPAHADGPVRTVRARRIVFALGLDGGGGPQIPEFIAQLPKDRWFHTEEDIDFDAFRGKRVAVLGGGASGFDNAGTALERGAARADVFMRRKEVPHKNPLRWMEFPGMQEHFYDLSDEQKWEFSVFNGGLPQPPTQHTIWRCFAQDGFTLHRGRGWHSVELVGDGRGGEELLIHTPSGEHRADAIIAATGYRTNLRDRPELAEFVDDIALWADRFEPAAMHPMGGSPYLGTGFEFQPRDQTTPWIERLHHFSTGARPSMGVTGNQLSGIYGGVKRMAWSIATSVTRENWPRLMNDFREFEHVEITSVGPHTDADARYPSGPRY